MKILHIIVTVVIISILVGMIVYVGYPEYLSMNETKSAVGIVKRVELFDGSAPWLKNTCVAVISNNITVVLDYSMFAVIDNYINKNVTIIYYESGSIVSIEEEEKK